MKTKAFSQTIFLTAASAALSATFMLFAPAPLMIIRRAFGRLSLFVPSIITSALLVVYGDIVHAFMFGAAVLVAGIYCECEGYRVNYTTAVLVSVLAAMGYLGLSVEFAVKYLGFRPLDFIHEQIQMMKTAVHLPASVTLEEDTILKQLPSALVILSLIMIWLNSIVVPGLERHLGLKPNGYPKDFVREDLLEWRLPDGFVWIALASICGAFLNIKNPTLKSASLNVFNIAVVLYFFQGLSVISHFLNFKKVGALWRSFTYLLVFTQLFLFVAFLGFVDFWLEFRSKAKPTNTSVAQQ